MLGKSRFFFARRDLQKAGNCMAFSMFKMIFYLFGEMLIYMLYSNLVDVKNNNKMKNWC